MKMPINSKNIAPKHFGFLVVPDFPLVPYSAAMETLRLANQVSKQKLYTWETMTVDGAPIFARCGLEITPKRALSNASSFSAVFVCGGVNIRSAWSHELGVRLRALSNKGIPLGALSTGAYLLARAGLLDGYRCAIHWERLAATREEFPDVNFTNAVYEIDKDRYTCAGGITAIDMMLHLVSQDYDKALMQAISDQFVLDRVRCHFDQQSIPLHHEIGTSQPKLTEVATLMSTNIEEPLTIDELSSYAKISRRQLERLFRSHLNFTPSQYYLRLRLKAARKMLMQTEKSITEISIDCGFSSVGHFSKRYRDELGLPPRSDRERLLGLEKARKE